MPPKFEGSFGPDSSPHDEMSIVWKKINFTQFLNPKAAQAVEAPGTMHTHSKYKNIKSKWTRELLEYRDHLEQKSQERQEHMEMQNALRANAAKRLRQKEKLVTVPIVEPPSGVDLTMLSTIQPHTRPPPPGSRNTSAAGAVTGVAPAEGECPADSKPPSVAAAMADEHGSSVTPRPLRDEAHSPNALSISHSPISKLHVELFPEAVAKYRQILCVASDMQQTKRLERCLNDDTAKTEALLLKERQKMAQIQKARQDVQSRQLQRKNELRANWEKRFEKVLRSKVDHDDALLQKLDALEKEEARRVIDSQAQSPSKSSEARDKLRRARERCERIEEEQRMREEDICRRRQVKEQNSERLREAVYEQHKQWQAAVQANRDMVCKVAQQRQQEARLRRLADIQEHNPKEALRRSKSAQEMVSKEAQKRLESYERIQERGAERATKRLEDRMKALVNKGTKAQARLQDLYQERTAKSMELKHTMLEKMQQAAHTREAQNNAKADKMQALLEASEQGVEARLKAMHEQRAIKMQQWMSSTCDARKDVVLDMDDRAAEELQATLKAREDSRLEAKREQEREDALAAEQNRKKTYQQRLERCLANRQEVNASAARHRHALLKASNGKLDQLTQAQKKDEEETRLKVRESATNLVERRLDNMSREEEERQMRVRKLEEKQEAIQQVLERREQQVDMVASKAAEIGKHKEFPETPNAMDAQRRRLEYAEMVQEREKNAQEARKEHEEEKQKKLTNQHKRWEKAEEKYEELVTERLEKMQRLKQVAEEKEERFAGLQQSKALERERQAVQLARSRQAKKYLAEERAQAKMDRSIGDVETRTQQRIDTWFFSQSM